MKNKEKKLEKALKLAGIDKEKWDDVVDLLSDDEEQPKEEEPKEEVKEKDEEEPKVESTDDGEPKPKEEPKVEEQEKPKQEESKDDDVLKEALALLKSQGEQIKTLEETIKKNESFGYSPKPKQGKADTSNEDIAKKMENLK